MEFRQRRRKKCERENFGKEDGGVEFRKETNDRGERYAEGSYGREPVKQEAVRIRTTGSTDPV